jgi:hypothetical protein
MIDAVHWTAEYGSGCLNSAERKLILRWNDAEVTDRIRHRYNIPAESAREVEIHFLLDRTTFIRHVLKESDELLLVGGTLSIHHFAARSEFRLGGFVRCLSSLSYEISISLGQRYVLEGRETNSRGVTLRFRKRASCAAVGDEMNRWSFGLVTDGRSRGRIAEVGEQLEQLRIPQWELLICGPSHRRCDGPQVRWISDDDLSRDSRPPICAKKNRLAAEAKWQNIVLFHERISFPPDWYSAMCAYGNYFEVLTNRICAEDDGSVRVQDWVSFKGDLSYSYSAQAGAMSYSSWSPEVYVDGGFLVAKKRVLLEVPLDERLHWGEGEDVHWAKRLYLAGVLIRFNSLARVTTKTHRHHGHPAQAGSAMRYLWAARYGARDLCATARERLAWAWARRYPANHLEQ